MGHLITKRGIGAFGRRAYLRHLGITRGFFQEVVDQGLIRLAPLCRQAAELSEEAGRYADRDELLRIAGFRTANPARAAQFYVRRFRKFRKIDPVISNRLRVLSGSHGAR